MEVMDDKTPEEQSHEFKQPKVEEAECDKQLSFDKVIQKSKVLTAFYSKCEEWILET